MDRMMDETPNIAQLEALYLTAIQGPYFVGYDEANDCPAHKDSGLALIDTGRTSDWPVARLCEWPTAVFIAALVNAFPALLAELTALRAENADLRRVIEHGTPISEYERRQCERVAELEAETKALDSSI